MTDFAVYIGVFTLGTLFGMLITAIFAIENVNRANKYEPPQNYED
jgi:hypothetical protein